MKQMNRLLLLGCLLMAFFLVLPTLAQDELATEDVDSVVAVDEDKGVEVVAPVIGSDDAVMVVDTASTLDWLQSFVLVAIFIFLVWTAYQRGGDSGVSTAILDFQGERENIIPLEHAYQRAPKNIQLAFDSATEAMFFLKNVTVLESSEALANLMKDIRVPGAPIADVPEDTSPPVAESAG